MLAYALLLIGGQQFFPGDYVKRVFNHPFQASFILFTLGLCPALLIWKDAKSDDLKALEREEELES